MCTRVQALLTVGARQARAPIVPGRELQAVAGTKWEALLDDLTSILEVLRCESRLLMLANALAI